MPCRLRLCLLCVAVTTLAVSVCVAQSTSTPDKSARTADKRSGAADSEGCKSTASKDAIDRAHDTARALPQDELGVFDSEGTLNHKLVLDGKTAPQAAKDECTDLKPISSNCWVCCSTGKIICKGSKSDAPRSKAK